jgi:hypothetical protein
MEESVVGLEQRLLNSLTISKESTNYINNESLQQLKPSKGELGGSCLAKEEHHFKSDFHRFNLRRKLKGLHILSEEQFDELEEISSIEASSDEEEEIKKPKEGSPFVHFTISNEEKELLVYKQVLSRRSTGKEAIDYLSLLSNIQIGTHQKSWILLMLSSGHFSGAVIDLTSGKPIFHKTFHRYTTRRKQGGAQSSNDKSKGKANSAGAGIRRYNEQALQEEIAGLLTAWKDHIQKAQMVFVRSSVQLRGNIFFDKGILDPDGKLIDVISKMKKCVRSLLLRRDQPSMNCSGASKNLTLFEFNKLKILSQASL